MELKDLIELHERTCKEERDLLLKKGNDYANGEDCLSNFKIASAPVRITPEQDCLALISTKVTRLGNLIDPHNKKEIKNESIRDTLLDLRNYAILFMALIEEKTENQK